jgi:hypothetical protein
MRLGYYGCIIFVVLFLWFRGGFVYSEDVSVVKVEMETKECERLIPRLFSRSSDYYEGIDVYGKAVVPADGGAGGVKGGGWLPKKIGFDLHVNLAKYTPKYGESLEKIGLSPSGGVAGGVAGGDSFNFEEEGLSRGTVKVLGAGDRAKKVKLEREIGALEVYERELVWTRRAILGDTDSLAEELVRLQDSRKRINKRLSDFEEVLLRDRSRIVGATGGEGEKNEDLLLLRRRELREAEERVYYGEDYLRWQRELVENSESQERVKEGMLIKDKAEEEGEEGALLVNERALKKTRQKLEVLRSELSSLLGVSGISGLERSGGERKVSSLPYGLQGAGAGVARVEYDLGQGLLTINGHPLQLTEIKRLVGKCQEVSRRFEKGL